MHRGILIRLHAPARRGAGATSDTHAPPHQAGARPASAHGATGAARTRRPRARAHRGALRWGARRKHGIPRLGPPGGALALPPVR